MHYVLIYLSLTLHTVEYTWEKLLANVIIHPCNCLCLFSRLTKVENVFNFKVKSGKFYHFFIFYELICHTTNQNVWVQMIDIVSFMRPITKSANEMASPSGKQYKMFTGCWNSLNSELLPVHIPLGFKASKLYWVLITFRSSWNKINELVKVPLKKILIWLLKIMPDTQTVTWWGIPKRAIYIP